VVELPETLEVEEAIDEDSIPATTVEPAPDNTARISLSDDELSFLAENTENTEESALEVPRDESLERILNEGIKPLAPPVDDEEADFLISDPNKDVTSADEIPAAQDENSDEFTIDLDNFNLGSPDKGNSEASAEAPAPAESVPVPEPEASVPETEPIAAPVEENAPQETASTPEFMRDLRSVLAYLDELLQSLPEEKIEEFAHSEYFSAYQNIFKQLGLSNGRA
jgi:hypothetical protein